MSTRDQDGLIPAQSCTLSQLLVNQLVRRGVEDLDAKIEALELLKRSWALWAHEKAGATLRTLRRNTSYVKKPKSAFGVLHN